MNISCLIEVVGVQDLAEEDPSTYISRTSAFRQALATILQRFRGDAVNDEAFVLEFSMWLDKCFIICNEPSTLLSFTQKLRAHLFEPGRTVLFRAYVCHGSAFKPSKARNSTSVDYLKESAELAGKLEHLKAIAIAVDSDVRDSILRSQEGASKNILSTLIATNVNLTSTDENRIEVFFDVPFLPKPENHHKLGNNLDDIFRLMVEMHQRSAKSTRYFIPLLANIIRSMPMNAEFLDTWTKLIDYMTIGGSALLKKTPNGQIPYYAIIDKYYSTLYPNPNDPNEMFKGDLGGIVDIVEQQFIQDFVSQNTWLSERLQKEHKCGRIPREVLLPANRGRLNRVFVKVDKLRRLNKKVV